MINGITNVDQTGHPLAPQHNRTSSCGRRLSINQSQASEDVNGDVAGNPTTRDLLSPSYRASTSDSPYHHDDQLSNADSGIRSGSYYEKTSMADSVILPTSDFDDRESSPESGIRLVPPHSEKVKNSPKSSIGSHHPMVMSQSNSSLQRAQSSISPSAVHPVTVASLSQANNSSRCHRLSVPSYLSSRPHRDLAWEAPHKSTVIVVTHSGKEIDKHSTNCSTRTTSTQCDQATPESNIQLASTQPTGSDAVEDDNNSDGDELRCVEIAWPLSWKRRILYPFLFPLIILLFFTLPNVNKPVSYLMVDLININLFPLVLAIFLSVDFRWEHNLDNDFLLFNGLVGIRNR